MSENSSRTRRRLRRISLENLEPRMLLSAGLQPIEPTIAIDPGVPPVATAAVAPLAMYPLTSVPALHSNPSATAKLFLDFDGTAAQTWGPG